MPQDLFPMSPGDAEEPGGSPLPPAAEETGPEDNRQEPSEQGLYVCLPAEQLTLSGFAQGGETDTMTPGPLLATVVHTVTGQDGAGLAGCSDDQLIGIISASQRMESNAEWTRLAAIAEFAARHPGASLEDEFAADELASELHLTPLQSSRSGIRQPGQASAWAVADGGRSWTGSRISCHPGRIGVTAPGGLGPAAAAGSRSSCSQSS
jgi:hypothetical protein